MRLAWRYAKRLRLDTAALARTDRAQEQWLAVELNDINIVLLKIQVVAVAS
jgi:hypothetical protein